MRSSEIRERFLKYFEKNGHKRVASASLIPTSDPTLYFTNAGMVPFKNIFTGAEKRPFPSATSSQKCLRVSGKHNDLENVGRTGRHHTFFEMLGNFSFGDYFKKEAVRFAWDFLTKEMKLPIDRLWITVYEKDDEAAEIWEKEIGIPKNRIVRLGEKENFWAMAETGPCGPCSEIHYDFGKGYGCGKKDCGVACDCDRFNEIWNLVFMQFNRDEGGKMVPLPKPSIDTGMGLERLAAVVQGKTSNYDSDLFTPIISAIEKHTGKKYGKDEETDISIRVLADHIRSASFLIADGIQPSNEGRGYVLRRILRRAIRHGKLLGMNEPFFFKLHGVVEKEMGEAYQELKSHRTFIEKVIKSEEERFLETLERGLETIKGEIKRIKKEKKKFLEGEIAFQLYDTYGFPVDLTEVIVSEEGLHVDMAGFEENMSEQRQRGRDAWKGTGDKGIEEVFSMLNHSGIHSEFAGYDQLETKGKILAIIKGGKEVSESKEGDAIEVVTDVTPFYAESGGQMGDNGVIESDGARLHVTKAVKPVENVISHHGKILSGRMKKGDKVILRVDRNMRAGYKAHHSATHLVHAALRKVLGSHVRQAGSLVTPHRFRFDFSHFEPVTKEQLLKVEDLANEMVRENLPVSTNVMPHKKAIETGALAFFGDKYGANVRVIQMGDFSTELCGGTHVHSTGEIGLIKILGESSVGAGVRRVEAIAGAESLNHLRRLEGELANIARGLKATPEEINEKLERLLVDRKKLEREVAGLKTKLVSGGGGSSKETLEEINGVKVLMIETEVEDNKLLRDLSDKLINKVGSGILLIAAKVNDKAALVVRVTKDLKDKYHAGNIINKLAPIIGGRGGGRPDMAEAGGSNPQNIPKAFDYLKNLI